MTRPHFLSFGTLIAIPALSLGCAQVLGDYGLVPGTTETTSTSTTSSGVGGSGAGGASSSSSSGSGGAGGQINPGTDPCPMGSVSEIVDTFDDNTTDDILWDVYPMDGTHVFSKETNQAITITTDGSAGIFGGYRSTSKIRSLVGCHIAVEVTQVPMPTNSNYAVRFELRDDTGVLPSYLRISHVGTDMVLHDYIEDAEKSSKRFTYDPVQHRWWRFRESQSTTYFETSPTGADGTWTVQHVIVSWPFEGAVYVNLTLGAKSDLLVNGFASVTFDNLNNTPK